MRDLKYANKFYKLARGIKMAVKALKNKIVLLKFSRKKRKQTNKWKSQYQEWATTYEGLFNEACKAPKWYSFCFCFPWLLVAHQSWVVRTYGLREQQNSSWS